MNNKVSNKKYTCECGICGEVYNKSEMIRDEGSFTGWLCQDCYVGVHPEYYDDDLDS